ncbi:MAG: Uma2 family endonuclease [Hyphomicrobiales bacterium]|nr:Uma2 family endonuclease [Hyphomicrobiales bacterium]
MNLQLPAQFDKASFLTWVHRREERFELVEGQVVMMVGASRAHGEIVSNLVGVLRDSLDRRQWTVNADFGLDAGPRTLRYPDVVVDRAGGNAEDYAATAPALVAEVLSPTPPLQRSISATRQRSICRCPAFSPIWCSLRTR